MTQINSVNNFSCGIRMKDLKLRFQFHVVLFDGPHFNMEMECYEDLCIRQMCVNIYVY